jgi:hypothetical protein
LAKALYKRAERDGLVRLDELATAGFAPMKQLAAAALELEANVLVHGGSVHTASGAHAKVLQTWSEWSSSHEVVRSPGYTLGRARFEFTEALNRLKEGSTKPVAMPLPVERRR